VAKIKIQAGKEAVEQAQSSGEFEEAPPGLYTGTLKSAEPGFAKTDGKPDKNRPYLECIYTLDGMGRAGDPFPDGKRYGQVWDYVSFGESSEWKVAQFGVAMGLPIKAGKIDGTIENEANKPGTVIGKKVLIGIKADTDQHGNYRAKVRNVYPLDGGAEAGSSDGLFDDDEEGTGSEPDGDLDAEFEGDGAATDGGEDYLTEDDLRDTEQFPDLKSLGELATEFDLDPKDSIVRFARGANKGKVNVEKTTDAIIAAILEAQGADDTGTDEGADDADGEEDPF